MRSCAVSIAEWFRSSVAFYLPYHFVVRLLYSGIVEEHAVQRTLNEGPCAFTHTKIRRNSLARRRKLCCFYSEHNESLPPTQEPTLLLEYLQ